MNSTAFKVIGAVLAAFGIAVEAMHQEVAGGQHEIDFRGSNALTTTDNTVPFRVALKVIESLNEPYDLAKHFIAGQLAHAKGMCAILAPLGNSYKRLVPGYEAPVRISWARINHAALIRVPRSTETEPTRVELRCPDPSCDPYLAFAVMLAAGLDGIRRRLPAVSATEENPYLADQPSKNGDDTLPSSLDTAIGALEEDEVIRDALGPHICRSFIETKWLE